MTRATPEIDRLRTLIDRRLDDLAAGFGAAPARLHRTIAYSLLAPGKRIRPLLLLAAAHDFGAPPETALDAACAVEMVHTASLVLDDLPCMDDATLRRGRPATHIACGESASIIAAVAMINEATRIVAADRRLSAASRCAILSALTGAIGVDGLVAGQIRDLEGDPSVAAAERTNREKTAALFVAAAEIGVLIAGAGGDDVQAVRRFASHLGMAFQLRDDLLDATATPEEAAKDVGQDAGKPTVLALTGRRRAKRSLDRHLDAALGALDTCSCRDGVLASFVAAAFPGTRIGGAAAAIAGP